MFRNKSGNKGLQTQEISTRISLELEIKFLTNWDLQVEHKQVLPSLRRLILCWMNESFTEFSLFFLKAIIFLLMEEYLHPSYGLVHSRAICPTATHVFRAILPLLSNNPVLIKPWGCGENHSHPQLPQTSPPAPEPPQTPDLINEPWLMQGSNSWNLVMVWPEMCV